MIPAALGLAMLIAGCSTAPAREPVLPEPSFVQTNSAECSALWSNGVDIPKAEYEPRPYGWSIVRIDVERGVVTDVEILDGSPRKVIDAPTLEHFRKVRFLSLGSAHGCIIRHKWG
ncbi:hypothetical protein SNE35_03955 [Paucibacter sp. R3-3]|uniref:TonB C-terminal domain-containing protein n=1 Tax=Roseateles agri TaxID=3098619 RepID=A0ABU5DCX4_9BURK|nr:hypothetical protein [Paucibacter sp. R3-3]MDY0743641.1 hypothetical protein [Paucibacter sp. R3-3]